jgi:hypothetical protein
MAGLTEFYCGLNEPSHASQFKWLEYTFKRMQKKECGSKTSLANCVTSHASLSF